MLGKPRQGPRLTSKSKWVGKPGQATLANCFHLHSKSWLAAQLVGSRISIRQDLVLSKIHIGPKNCEKSCFVSSKKLIIHEMYIGMEIE